MHASALYEVLSPGPYGDSDGSQPARGPVAEPVDSTDRFPVRGEEDDQLLRVRGQFEGFAVQKQFAPRRMTQAQSPPPRHHMPVQGRPSASARAHQGHRGVAVTALCWPGGRPHSVRHVTRPPFRPERGATGGLGTATAATGRRPVGTLSAAIGGSVLDMDFRHTVERAQRLKQLHADFKPLVLPTVWDVWSARTAAGAGFPALTVGSHPLADSRGAEDQEGQTFEEVLAAVRPIIAAVDVPVSVDLEAGYGQKPADLIAGLTEVGGVGLNIEDTVHSDGGRVRTTQEHASYIAGLRAAADDAGIPVWINGRTDLFLHAENASDVLDEAIERLRAMEEAGADSVYPVRIQDNDELLTAVTGAVGVPVNSTAHPVKHDLERFRRLGVGRITYGPLLQLALTDAMKDMLRPWAP